MLGAMNKHQSIERPLLETGAGYTGESGHFRIIRSKNEVVKGAAQAVGRLRRLFSYKRASTVSP